MNQVHKESLDKVENALPNRDGLDIEIFGMEGVPEDMLAQHRTRIITNYYEAQEARRAATGNPPPGQSGGQGPAKKIKIETPDEIKKRLAEHKARRALGQTNGNPGSDVPNPAQSASPGSFVSPELLIRHRLCSLTLILIQLLTRRPRPSTPLLSTASLDTTCNSTRDILLRLYLQDLLGLVLQLHKHFRKGRHTVLLDSHLPQVQGCRLRSMTLSLVPHRVRVVAVVMISTR